MVYFGLLFLAVELALMDAPWPAAAVGVATAVALSVEARFSEPRPSRRRP